jgi:vancomycin resistance protein VanJ
MTVSTIQIYSFAVLLWWLARLIYADQIWWLALLNTVALLLFVPLPCLALLALLTRNWRGAWMLCLPLVLFGTLYGPLFLPRWPQPPPAGAQTLTTMSFNVLYSTSEPTNLLRVIEQTRPDIFGLQELTPSLARQITPLIQQQYPFQALDVAGPEAGVGLWSRYPIRSYDTFALPPRNLALRATLAIEGRSVVVIVAHLSANRALSTALPELPEATEAYYRHQMLEVADLLSALPPAEQPALVLCDCNLTDTSAAYRRLASVLDDSFREAGWGFGHTFGLEGTPFPIQRIDYIWHSDAFTATQAFVGPESGSDHRPLLAQLALAR